METAALVEHITHRQIVEMVRMKVLILVLCQCVYLIIKKYFDAYDIYL